MSRRELDVGSFVHLLGLESGLLAPEATYRIEQLLTLEADSHDVVADLARVLPRLGRYRERLQQAASGVAAGDTAKFTGVMCGSFHDIWMELHEDLIVLQDIDRVAEGSF